MSEEVVSTRNGGTIPNARSLFAANKGDKNFQGKSCLLFFSLGYAVDVIWNSILVVQI